MERIWHKKYQNADTLIIKYTCSKSETVTLVHFTIILCFLAKKRYKICGLKYVVSLSKILETPLPAY